MHPVPVQWFKKYGPLVLLLVVWGLFWWAGLGGGQLLYMRDLTFYALPMKTYLLERLQAGEFPFWTPYLSAGMPFFAEASHQVLYPLNLLLLCFPSVVQAIHATSLLQTLLGMLAVYGLARALRLSPVIAAWSAGIYGFSGYLVSITDNVNYQPATVWCPFGFWALIRLLETQKRVYFVLFSGAIALMLLAGDSFNTLFFGLYSVGLLGLRWRMPDLHPGLSQGRAWIVVLAGFGLAGLLAAVQLLPEKELLDFSVRQVPLRYEEITLWSFPPQRLIEFLQPFFYGSKYPNPHFVGMFLYPEFREPWADSVYIGVIPVLLALWAWIAKPRQALFWGAMLVSGLLLSFGHFGFYYPALLKIFPPLQQHRYLEKFIYWPTLAIAILAGQGAAALWSQTPKALESLWNRPVAARLMFSLLLMVFGGALFLEIPAQLWIWPHALERSMDWGSHLFDRQQHLQGLWGHWLLLLGLLSLVFWLSKDRFRVYLAGVLLVGLLDLVWVHWNHTPMAPATLLAQRPVPYVVQQIKAHQAAQKQTEPYRVFYDDKVAYQEYSQAGMILKRVAAAYHLPSLEDNYPYYWAYRVLYNQDRLMFNYGITYRQRYLNGRFAPLHPLYHRQMDDLMFQYHPTLLMALCSVNYIVTSVFPENPSWNLSNYEEIVRNPQLNVRVLHFKNALPHAYIAPNALFNSDPALYAVLSKAFQNYKAQVELDAPELAVLEPSSSEPLNPLLPSQVRVHRTSPEFYTLETVSPYTKAYLLLTEGFFPGWQAWIDGVPTPIYRANHRFMGITLPQGRHQVVFRYHSTYFEAGLWLSGLGLLFCMGLLCFPAFWRTSVP